MSSGLSDSGKQGVDGSGFEDEESTRRRHAPGFSYSFFVSFFFFLKLLPRLGCWLQPDYLPLTTRWISCILTTRRILCFQPSLVTPE